jgi:DNA-binding LytR/AlgR family response regulator
MNLPSIIVDDEPLARDVLIKYISDCPMLELISVCKSAFEALEVLNNHEVRIIFLDINMPKLSGLSMVRSLQNPPQIIFTTAYPEYAVEGFEVDAVDYLVKPFSFDRFMKAVNKALIREEYLRDRAGDGFGEDKKYFHVKADGKLYQVEHNDILYFEALGDYVKVITNNKKLLTHDTLKNVEDSLPVRRYLRIHRSFIISLEKIEFVEGNRVKIGDDFIPVGQSYKANLESYLADKQ